MLLAVTERLRRTATVATASRLAFVLILSAFSFRLSGMRQ